MKRPIIKISTLLGLIAVLFFTAAFNDDCGSSAPSSDQRQQADQERLLQEGTSQVGMPAIKNFRERKIYKDILELRDQEGLVTYTYVKGEVDNKICFYGETIGFGIPYATQFTNPQKVAKEGVNYGYAVLPQADPNGLFSPASADATWVLLKDPDSGNVRAEYVESKIIVSQIKRKGVPSCWPSE